MEPSGRDLGLHFVFRDLDSASITASVLDYEFENGRRYHAYKAGSYPLPNDEVRLQISIGPRLPLCSIANQPRTIWKLKCHFAGRVGSYRPQTPCCLAARRWQPSFCSSKRSEAHSRYRDRDGNLGNRDCRTIPRSSNNWNRSVASSTEVVGKLIFFVPTIMLNRPWRKEVDLLSPQGTRQCPLRARRLRKPVLDVATRSF